MFESMNQPVNANLIYRGTIRGSHIEQQGTINIWNENKK